MRTEGGHDPARPTGRGSRTAVRPGSRYRLRPGPRLLHELEVGLVAYRAIGTEPILRYRAPRRAGLEPLVLVPQGLVIRVTARGTAVSACHGILRCYLLVSTARRAGGQPCEADARCAGRTPRIHAGRAPQATDHSAFPDGLSITRQSRRTLATSRPAGRLRDLAPICRQYLKSTRDFSHLPKGRVFMGVMRVTLVCAAGIGVSDPRERPRRRPWRINCCKYWLTRETRSRLE